MSKYKTMDANEAVSSVAYKFSEVCGIYPITPSSPMAEHVDVMASKGEVNYFGNGVDVVEMQSEAGAIAMCHGALQSGILSSTFTSSQGLLLMIPSLYKMAGELLPGVIHVAARSLSTHSLSIFGDHQDINAVRSTGVCMLSSSSVQEAYYMAAIAHLSSISSSLPFINFFDGFRTSHEIDKVKLMDMDKVGKFIDKKELIKFRDKAMNSNKPNTRGTAENDDIYFQHTEARNKYYVDALIKVEDIMDKMNRLNGTNIKPFNYYGSKNANYVIVAMGSVCETIREVVDYCNKNGKNYGMVEVHLYRPFNSSYLRKVIPNTVKSIAVMDRTKDAANDGEPLYLDVVNALKDKNVHIVGGRYGLSSKDTNPSQIKAVYDMLEGKKLKEHFTVGINDDITNLSLDIDESFVIPFDGVEFLIYGYGSDGMVSTVKDLIKIIGNNTKSYAQGYFQYDSKKSGGVTRSHVRISDKEIHRPYYVTNPSLVVISRDSYLYKFDMLDNIQVGGTVLVNTSLKEDDLIRSLPNKVKYLMAKKKLKLFVIDAYNLVAELGLRGKISTCMEVCIFDIINVLSKKRVNSIMKDNNIERFKRKGKAVIDINNKIIDESLRYLKEVKVDKSWEKLPYIDSRLSNFDDVVSNLKGDSLPVSAFMDKASGIYRGNNTSKNVLNSDRIPCWNSENCIQCNQCAFVCPHGVIRPFLLDKNDKEVESVPSIFPRDLNYSIGISVNNCTGCGLCSQVCPGKMGKKAIEMVDNDGGREKQEDFDYLLKNNVNGSNIGKVLNVKSEGFIQPKFEFSGSCSGCGETAYLKNLTQVFNNNLFIANATGCSSIYGGSVPLLPYDVPWASSLFEDNSEFGLGIYKGIEIKRRKIYNYMKNNLGKEKKLFKLWLDNMNNYDICLKVYNEIDYVKHKELSSLRDYITPKSVWIVGGDGFAYDIGYGGLDHVLSRNENINILVLDTEVYSNTGGQTSKSSNLGSVVQFSARGKQTYKKDLARIAMCYPGCYVACVNIGYDKEQYLKVLKEAHEHDGPSIVIAYSPCIEHGIKGGMENSLNNSRLATVCGYFLTFRYNPSSGFKLDCKEPDFSKYDEFLMSENRYNNLKSVNKEEADVILDNQKKWAIDRYNYYKKLDSTLE